MSDWNGFVGTGKRLDDIDLPRIGARIGVGEDELHAFLEVESRNRGFDQEGRPLILFEPHVFYRNLPKDKRATAVAQRLAAPKWGTIPYGKESAQYDRLERALRIDEAAALKACSWGMTQVLGESYRSAGYDSVQEMVRDFMEDEDNHLEAAVNYIIANSIDDDLRNHRWETVARVYNGPGYRKNGYHTKMAAAFRKWRKIKDTEYVPDDDLPDHDEDELDAVEARVKAGKWPEDMLSRDQIEIIQKRLRELGYFIVGKVDGRWGKNTTAAISALQKVAGIETDGHWGPKTKRALADDLNRAPVDPARRSTTVDDLRNQGSKTVIKADEVKAEASSVGTTATTLGVGSVIAMLFDILSNFMEPARELIDPIKGYFNKVPAEIWFLIVAVVAYHLYERSRKQAEAADEVQAARLHAEQTGLHNGEPDPAPSPPITATAEGEPR